MVDIIVLAILAVCAFLGYQKGLLRMILSIVASVLTIIVAVVVFPYVNDYVKENTDIYSKVEASIQTEFENYIKEYQASTSEGEIKEQQGNFIESLGLPKAIESMILENNTLEYYAQQGISTFSQYISKILAGVVISTAIFAISYIVLFILIRVVFVVVRIVDYLPFIREANNMAGMILCLSEALLIIWVLCLMATPFSGIGEFLNGLIQQSKVLQILYQYNPLVLFFN